MFDQIRIWSAARRLGLRDKGQIGESYTVEDGKTLVSTRVCAECRTRIRIGIDTKGIAHRYCWRCEWMGENISQSPDPKGREDIPIPVVTSEEADSGSNVIKLKQRKSRKE